MAEYICREEFLKRIKPYDTSDKTDKALYNFALNQMMFTPNANVIPIPAGATNGDMFKAMFPNIEVKPQMSYGFKNGFKVRVYEDEFSVFDLWFPKEWWNAPYKREAENE